MKALLLILVFAGAALAEPPAISWNQPRHYVAENFRTSFELRIPHDDRNRRVEVEAIDQSDGERVSFSDRPIEGRSPAIQEFALVLPRGALLLKATLYAADENGVETVRGRAQARVRVLSPYDPPEDDELGDEP
jgi:hypothetical protein